MKFNEKLTELRRQEGFSQEELGEKLNVTRQTVSKWELGQTTPEMGKLKEIAELFHVTVDELLNEEKPFVSVEEPIKVNTKKETNWRPIIIIGILILLLIASVYYLTNYLLGKRVINKYDSVWDSAQNMIQDASNIKENIENKRIEAKEKYEAAVENKEQDFNNMYNKMTSFIGTSQEEIEAKNKKNSHNGTFESLYTGVLMGGHVKSALNNVISINQKGEKKIDVVYAGETTNDISKIAKVSSKLNDFKDYLVSYEYDEDGYICKMKISKA